MSGSKFKVTPTIVFRGGYFQSRQLLDQCSSIGESIKSTHNHQDSILIMPHQYNTNAELTGSFSQSNVIMKNYFHVRSYTSPASHHSSLNSMMTDDNDVLEIPMAFAIYHKRYDIIREKLTNKSSGEDPNKEILFQNVYMTGLEYSIYNHDWRMAIVFYIHAADPKYNCFDGRVLRKGGADSGSRPASPTQTYHICENDGRPIEGFKGLYCLLNPTVSGYNSTLSALWLMEQGHSGKEVRRRLDSVEALTHARNCVLQVGAGSVWNEVFCKRVYTILLSLRQASSASSTISGNISDELPHEISLHILDFVVDDILSFSIWKSLMHVSFISANAMKNQLFSKCEEMDCY